MRKQDRYLKLAVWLLTFYSNKWVLLDTIRFLNQFSVGRGDYTKERDSWLGGISMDDAIDQIKAGKNKA